MSNKLITNFIFSTFDEAMDVHKQLFRLLREDGYVRYETLYIYINKERPEDNEVKEYGWGNLWDSKVEPLGIDGDWVLKLPEPQKLKDILKK